MQREICVVVLFSATPLQRASKAWLPMRIYFRFTVKVHWKIYAPILETTNCTVRTVLITFKYSIPLESNFKDEVAVLQSTEIDSRLFPHIEKLKGTFLTHKDQEKCCTESYPTRSGHSIMAFSFIGQRSLSFLKAERKSFSKNKKNPTPSIVWKTRRK